LNASDVVFLYANSFVAADNWRTDGYTLDHSGAKVQKHPLARMVLLAALAQLLQGNWIEMPMVKTGFVFTQDWPTLRMGPAGACPLRGVEGRIAAAIDGRGDWQNMLPQIIGRVVGGQHDDPWQQVFLLVREHLVEAGYFNQYENPAAQGLGRIIHSKYIYKPNQGLIAQSAGSVAWVQGLLASMEAADPHRWKKTVKAVDGTLKGLKREQDRNDY
jgi:hypothetical protein